MVHQVSKTSKHCKPAQVQAPNRNPRVVWSGRSANFGRLAPPNGRHRYISFVVSLSRVHHFTASVEFGAEAHKCIHYLLRRTSQANKTATTIPKSGQYIKSCTKSPSELPKSDDDRRPMGYPMVRPMCVNKKNTHTPPAIIIFIGCGRKQSMKHTHEKKNSEEKRHKSVRSNDLV